MARDPLLGCALLLLQLERDSRPGDRSARGFVLDGVLTDLGLSLEQVRTFAEEHRAELERLLDGQGTA